MHSPLGSFLARLSARVDYELSMYLMLSINFILYVTILPFLFSFFFSWCWKVYILRYTSPTLLLWNGNHNLVYYVLLQEFCLWFCILSCKYYLWHLCICLCNESDLEPYDSFHYHYHPHILFCICRRLFDWCMIHSLHMAVVSSPFLQTIICMLSLFCAGRFVASNEHCWILNSHMLYVSLILM